MRLHDGAGAVAPRGAPRPRRGARPSSPARATPRRAAREVLSCWNTSKRQIICIQVVPCLERVLITMSPVREGKPDYRERLRRPTRSASRVVAAHSVLVTPVTRAVGVGGVTTLRQVDQRQDIFERVRDHRDATDRNVEGIDEDSAARFGETRWLPRRRIRRASSVRIAARSSARAPCRRSRARRPTWPIAPFRQRSSWPSAR